MDNEIFKKLCTDNKVIKFGELSGRYFLSQNENLVVGFFFMHRGYPRQYSTDPEKRIILSVFPLENLIVDIPLKKVDNEFVVLANSDNQDYALSYLITIDEEMKSATVKIKDYPEMGSGIITEPEQQGLTQTYKK